MLSIKVTGDREVIARVHAVEPKIRANLRKTVTKLRLELEALVKAKLSDDVLHVKTGALRSGVFSETIEGDGSIGGRVVAGKNVPYAAIQEFGGTINHPGGTAYFPGFGLGGLAVFISNRSEIASKLPRTAPHEIHIPERSYMRSSLSEMRLKIVTELTAATKQGTQEK